MSGHASDYAALTLCDDQSICCGLRNTTCCNAGAGVWLENGQVVSTRSSSPTTSALAGFTTTPTANERDSIGNADGLTTGGKVGVGVGVTVAVIIIFSLGFIALRERRLRQEAEMQRGIPSTSQPYEP